MSLMSTTRFPLILLSLALASTTAASDASRSAAAMTSAARAFLATLGTAQRDAVLLPLAAEERTVWSNLPIVMQPTPGLLVADMNPAQKLATHELLRASLSSQGYAKFTGVMRLEDLLYQFEEQQIAAGAEGWDDPVRLAVHRSRRYGNYAVSVYGEPGTDGWGWKIAGHHAALNFTVARGQVGFTPTFLGSAPQVVPEGDYAGFSVLSHEGRRGQEFMYSLTAEQQARAIIADSMPDDVLEGPGRRASLARFEGLKLDSLTSPQQRLLRALVVEYVNNADFDAAEAQLALIEAAGWGELWFSWRGSVVAGERYYYRVHGPRILIEYSRQDANHDHMIVRDPRNDYGEDWLGIHYAEQHPTLEQALENVRRAVAPASDSK